MFCCLLTLPRVGNSFLTLFHSTHRSYQSHDDEERGWNHSVREEQAKDQHNTTMITIVLVLIAIAFIVGVISIMAFQRDDVRFYFLSVNRTINVHHADVRPRVETARTASIRRMNVTNNPRM